MSASKHSHNSAKSAPRLVSPIGNPNRNIHDTPDTRPTPDSALPSSLKSIQRRAHGVYASVKNAMGSVHSSSPVAKQHQDGGADECVSQLSAGSADVPPATVDAPTKPAIDDIPVQQLSTPQIKLADHRDPVPTQSEMLWRNHVINVNGLSASDPHTRAPLTSPTPNLPMSSHPVSHLSHNADMLNDPGPLQARPSVVNGHVATEDKPSQYIASSANELISERGNEDDQQSALSGNDAHSEFGALYCDPSKENDGDPFSDPSVLAKLKNFPGRVLLGYTWEEYTKPCPSVDFSNTHPPWIGWHADKGYILSFPAYDDNKCQSKANYLRHFKNVTYDPTKLPKSWREQFPTFPKNADLDTIPIFHFVRALVVHCYNHNIYCPPIHTVNKLEPRGWWYNDLSPSTQHLVQEYWSSLLHASLSDAKTGLIAHARLHSLLNGVSDGYAVIVQLLMLGRHPHLTVHSVRRPMPTQGSLSLLKYFNAWQETLLIDTIRGITPSDRAYVYWVVNGLHSSMQRVGERVLRNMERERDDAPLPLTFAPCYLFQLFSSEAFALGVSINVRPRSGDDVDAVVNVVKNAHGKKTSTNKDRPAKPPKLPRTCYLCDGDHIIRDCPKLPEMRRQLPTNASKMVRRLVNDPELAPGPADDLIRSIFVKSGLVGETPSDVSVDSGSDDDASVTSADATVFR